MHKNRSTMNMNMSSSMWVSRCSEEIVLNDEDLLTLILLRPPYRKLKSFKCVAKKWLYLITTPQFISRLLCNFFLPPLRASGLFIQRPPFAFSSKPCPNEVYFVPLDDPNTPSPFKTIAFADYPFDPERIRILGSCNGLLLCSTCILAFGIPLATYVYNPSTNQLHILPKHPPAIGVEYLSLAFDPSKSPHYKVVAYVSTSKLDYIGDLNFAPVPGSTVSDGLYFNVDEGRLGIFPRPPIDRKKLTTSRSSYFGESDDHLHFIGVYPNATSLSVYELKSDYSEWFIKYWIDLASISKFIPEMTKYKACYVDGKTYAFAVLSLIRREKFQEDSFLVLEIPGKVIRYNLVDTSFKAIWDFDVDLGVEKVDIWRFGFGTFRVWQYIEALSCV
ncbi:hypothetical protein OROHE_003281 [Orobanche hederae]